jgi:hypothetical protein
LSIIFIIFIYKIIYTYRIRVSLFFEVVVSPYRCICIPYRCNLGLYADDVLFIRPIANDIANLHQLLLQFGQATGLNINIQKSEIFPIHCSAMDIPSILGDFHVKQGTFPCTYLGMPLKLGRLTRHDEQKLVDKVAAKLRRWKGRLITKTGRLTLVNYHPL